MVAVIMRVVPRYPPDVGQLWVAVPFLGVLALCSISPWVLATDPLGYQWARWLLPLRLARFGGVVVSSSSCRVSRVLCAPACVHEIQCYKHLVSCSLLCLRALVVDYGLSPQGSNEPPGPSIIRFLSLPSLLCSRLFLLPSIHGFCLRFRLLSVLFSPFLPLVRGFGFLFGLFSLLFLSVSSLWSWW